MAPLRFAELSDTVHHDIALFLSGHDVGRLAVLAPSFACLFQLEQLWATLLERDYGHSGLQMLKRRSASSAYRACSGQAYCRCLRWYRVPCAHELGNREGSPGMFAWRGFLFVYGGWGDSGPARDLHAGRLRHPLVLHQVALRGSSPPAGYEMKVTPLAEDLEGDSPGDATLLVAVTGGYLFGGYRRESDVFGVMEIALPGRGGANAPAPADVSPGRTAPGDDEEPLPSARWLHVGSMTPRSNHSATFVPARLAGSLYARGALVLFGGNVRGRCSNTVDVLDLESMSWEFEKVAGGAAPSPRNSHTAALQTTADGCRLLVVGGGTGDASNGGPPRGGSDLDDAHFLDLRTLEWTPAARMEACAEAVGRGHVLCEVAGTHVAVGGGRRFHTAALRGHAPVGRAAGSAEGRTDRHLAWPVESAGATGTTGPSGLLAVFRASLPGPRMFGGGCALPDGTILIYGGWHPQWGTYGDLWAAHADGWETPFLEPLCRRPPAAPRNSAPAAATESGSSDEGESPGVCCACCAAVRGFFTSTWGLAAVAVLAAAVASRCWRPGQACSWAPLSTEEPAE